MGLVVFDRGGLMVVLGWWWDRNCRDRWEGAIINQGWEVFGLGGVGWGAVGSDWKLRGWY